MVTPVGITEPGEELNDRVPVAKFICFATDVYGKHYVSADRLIKWSGDDHYGPGYYCILCCLGRDGYDEKGFSLEDEFAERPDLLAKSLGFIK